MSDNNSRDEDKKEESTRKNFFTRLKLSIKDMFTGDDGSFFWLIQKFFETLKLITEGINGWLAARRNERARKREELDGE